jgi:hypothetical protein
VKWVQELYQASKQEQANKQGLVLPYSSYIDSVSSETEKAIIRNWATRGRELSISHPFISSGSWIRAIPEQGAQYMTTNRADDSEPQLIASIAKGTEGRIQAYRDKVGLFRALAPGEIEVSSSGISQAFYSSRPFSSTRAGNLLRTMNQDDLSIMERAPIHLKQFLNYKVGELGDEYRVGIVSRYKNSWKTIYPKLNEKYMAEEYFSLTNPALSAPNILFKIHRGHVTDKLGTPINHKKTQLPLRLSQQYFANDDTSTAFEVDQSGNYLIQLAQAATEGMYVDVPNGNFRSVVEKDTNWTVNGNWSLILKGTRSEDIQGAKKILVTKAYSLKADSISEESAKAYTVKTQSYKMTASSSYDVTATGAAKIVAQAKAEFMGTAGTDVGSPASITNVNGSLVNIGGGGAAIARLGDTVVSIGNLGYPAVGTIISGSPKVTSA